MGHKKGFGKPTTRPHRPCQDMDDRAYYPCRKILPNFSYKNMPIASIRLINMFSDFMSWSLGQSLSLESGCKVT